MFWTIVGALIFVFWILPILIPAAFGAFAFLLTIKWFWAIFFGLITLVFLGGAWTALDSGSALGVMAALSAAIFFGAFFKEIIFPEKPKTKQQIEQETKQKLERLKQQKTDWGALFIIFLVAVLAFSIVLLLSV